MERLFIDNADRNGLAATSAPALVQLSLANRVFNFAMTSLDFSAQRITDPFARKNNKTVRETLQHPKYIGLTAEVLAQYPDFVDSNLGEFVLQLKSAGTSLYRKFLNRHGDLVYCEFRLKDSLVGKLKGLYCFTVGGELRYIGKSTDSFERRISQGYGRIHPKNCYRDGQSTNCHLNGLIAAVSDDVQLHVHPMIDDAEIRVTEIALILRYRPEWNIQMLS